MKTTKKVLSATLITGFLAPIITSASFINTPAQTGGGVTVDQIQNVTLESSTINNQIEKEEHKGRGNSKNKMKFKNKEDKEKGDPGELIKDLPLGILTDIDKENIIDQYLEEKMANEMYTSLYFKYNIETFKHIADAEKQHMLAVKALADKYGIELPQTGFGKLETTFVELQDKANKSLKNALEVGIAIEKIDIDDTSSAIKETVNNDFQIIFTKIGSASYNHMKGFVQALKNNKLTTDIEYNSYLPKEFEDVKGEIKDLFIQKLEKEGVTLPETTKTEYKHRGIENGQQIEKNKSIITKARNNIIKAKNRIKAIKAKAYKKFTGKLKEKKIFKDKEKIKNSEAVSFLQQRGIINGYENGDFGPENSVNRAEATKMILEALNIQIEPVITSKFKDVNKNAWFAGYVNKAREQGIIKGYSDGTFKPEATVNQAELIKILLEAFQIDLTNYEVVDFDSNQWFSKYLQYAKDNQLIESSNLEPGKLLTRDEFSSVIYNLIKQQELLAD